jgi:acetylornithine deacetylase/succinyl-diaminopimelate desuccinylase-like protein
MRTTTSECERLLVAVQRQRLLDTAMRLIDVPSRTGEAKGALDCLATILADDGFVVQRPTGGYVAAPAVLVRLAGQKPGKTLQFNGHLDTVHLPFVAPSVEGDLLRGSGAADMKAGMAAAADGIHGDAVLLPEYLHDVLPIIGRGGLSWKVAISRPGPTIHEVMRPDEPNVISVGARLIERLLKVDAELARTCDPMAGPESVFIGRICSGEIYNQYPHECRLEGTRRWLPGTTQAKVERELRAVTDELARDTGTTISIEFCLMRDAFVLEQDSQFASAFQEAHWIITGKTLPVGAKPFCDDGNSFWVLAGIPAVTHGPRAGGAHTTEEWVSIDDLVRVAKVYALTALEFCGE